MSFPWSSFAKNPPNVMTTTTRATSRKHFFSSSLLLFFFVFLERRRRLSGVLLPLKMTCWGVVQCSELYRVRRKQRKLKLKLRRNVRQLIVCCFTGAVESRSDERNA